MAKRKKPRRNKDKPVTEGYRGAEGGVLALRTELSSRTISKIGEAPASHAASLDDAWRRRSELLFERLVVSWEIAGLEPMTDQQMLLGRYRLASAEEQRWVRETIEAHLRRFIPELAGG
ncbi:MAG: hypothetical protein ABR536_04740 [Solirubrobacterales bacterium]